MREKRIKKQKKTFIIYCICKIVLMVKLAYSNNYKMYLLELLIQK